MWKTPFRPLFLCGKLIFFTFRFMHLHPSVRIVRFTGKRNRNIKIKVNEIVIVIINVKEPTEFLRKTFLCGKLPLLKGEVAAKQTERLILKGEVAAKQSERLIPERRGGCEADGEVNSERRGANRKIDGEVTLRRRDTVGTRRAVTALTVHIVGYGVPDIPQFYVTCP